MSVLAGDPTYTLYVNDAAQWPIVKFVKWVLRSSTVEVVFQFDRDTPLCRGCFIRIADELASMGEVSSNREARKIVLRTRKREFDTNRQGFIGLMIDGRLDRCHELHHSRFA